MGKHQIQKDSNEDEQSTELGYDSNNHVPLDKDEKYMLDQIDQSLTFIFYLLDFMFLVLNTYYYLYPTQPTALAQEPRNEQERQHNGALMEQLDGDNYGRLALKSEGESSYELECILDSGYLLRPPYRKRRFHYKVKWVSYDDPTWVPIGSFIFLEDAILEFERRRPDRPRPEVAERENRGIVREIERRTRTGYNKAEKEEKS